MGGPGGWIGVGHGDRRRDSGIGADRDVPGDAAAADPPAPLRRRLACAAARGNADAVAFDEWVQKTAALPADKQVEAVAAKLKDRNPGFDGKVTPTIENGVVTGLEFVTDQCDGHFAGAGVDGADER